MNQPETFCVAPPEAKDSLSRDPQKLKLESSLGLPSLDRYIRNFNSSRPSFPLQQVPMPTSCSRRSSPNALLHAMPGNKRCVGTWLPDGPKTLKKLHSRMAVRKASELRPSSGELARLARTLPPSTEALDLFLAVDEEKVR